MGELTFSTFLEHTALLLINIVDIDGLHEFIIPTSRFERVFYILHFFSFIV